MKKWFVFALMGLVTACGAETGADAAATQDGEQAINGDRIRAVMEEAFDGIEISAVRPSPIAGVAEVEVEGRDTVYVSNDAGYILVGNLLQIKDGEVVDPSEQRFEKVRKEGIAKLDMSQMITYPAEDQKHEVYVFTDISCGYCRKLHRHIEEYNEEGVTVHYLAFPRGGPTAKSAAAMRHIWCAEDPQAALTDAKLNDQISEAELGECAKPVDSQYALGLTFGVRGTPAIYTPEGKQLGGYVAPAELLKRLD
ncbi:DsbC family protein [Alcanivorax sp. DP30]|uniref:DsbC family protein n=1 Tax=Alcanivorax sp. DP30 TaxID=2606217 RepID=UPI00136BE92C|nr:DsbC family protein [Alcanivorax sp. DP30]MZR63961.1 thioredoxin fold domain-containing protein [Alcanivorax sp. DP30]